jgi:hypothetical protein
MDKELEKDLKEVASKLAALQEKHPGVGSIAITTLSDCILVGNNLNDWRYDKFHCSFTHQELKNVPTGIDTETNNLQQQDTTDDTDFASIKNEKLGELIDLQVEDNIKKAPIHDFMGAYGYIKEEVEETEEELVKLKDMLDAFWLSIRKDRHHDAITALEKVQGSAYWLASEAIDVASVAEKAIKQLGGNE